MKTYYLPSHEYVKIEGDTALVGISEYAAKQLGNVVYVDMPETDDEVTAGEDFGAIESVKAASDLYSPVTGTVVEINEELIDNPRLINEDPMNNWIIKVQLSEPLDESKLLTPEQYEATCK